MLSKVNKLICSSIISGSRPCLSNECIGLYLIVSVSEALSNHKSVDMYITGLHVEGTRAVLLQLLPLNVT